jgi:outer membrane protein assembly factor BamE (lipoprotein component of BamABCDE complex)
MRVRNEPDDDRHAICCGTRDSGIGNSAIARRIMHLRTDVCDRVVAESALSVRSDLGTTERQSLLSPNSCRWLLFSIFAIPGAFMDHGGPPLLAATVSRCQILAGRHILVTFSFVAWSACSYAIRPPTIEAGRSFSQGGLDQVRKGYRPAQVRNLLGEPYETDGNVNAERWRYYMRVRGAEERRFLGFVPMPDSKSLGEYEAFVTFRNGLVDSVTSSRKRLQ